MTAFVDEVREELGVEPVCEVLQFAPSTYYAAKKREASPSRRRLRDEEDGVPPGGVADQGGKGAVHDRNPGSGGHARADGSPACGFGTVKPLDLRAASKTVPATGSASAAPVSVTVGMVTCSRRC
ncbi:hypothetical protein ACPCTO_37675, partial [Streptomyces olivoreticuli]